jgi:EmrB/QacA subfamily drug resistance transporter
MRKTNRPLTVAGLVLSLFMAALEATVVSTAMPTVIGDLGGIELYSWVFTAYLLTATVFVPAFGKLADQYGRKPILLLGIGIFLVGSAASGAARSMTQLIAFRALQGLGAGAMQPIAITVVGDIFDLEERSRTQGLFGAAWGFAGLIGPLLGGFIVHAFSWRWIFYVNLPFGLAAMALIFFSLHESVEHKPHRVDFAGITLLSSGVLALLYGVSGSQGGLSWLLVAAALLTLFVVVEARAHEPLLPLELFSRRVMAVSSLAGAIVGGSLIATMTYVPLFVQAVLGGSPTDAGKAITPMVIGWPIASVVSGRLIPRIGFRPLIRVGFLITAVAAIALAALARPGASPWTPRLMTALFGIGLGLANTALLIAVQTSVRWEQRGVATASTMFFRTIGGMIAVGVMGGVLSGALRSDPTIPLDAASGLLDKGRGASIEPAARVHLVTALERGLSSVFWIIAGLAVAAALVGLLFPGKIAAEPASVSP